MIVYTGGTFDLLHPGHVRFLRRCAALALPHRAKGGVNALVIGLNTDEFVEEYKGRPPTQPYDDRKAMLEALSVVDQVIPNTGGADSRPAILKAFGIASQGSLSAVLFPPQNPHPAGLVAIGSDWHGRDYLAQMGFDWQWLDRYRLSLVYIPRVTPHSATALKEAIRHA